MEKGRFSYRYSFLKSIVRFALQRYYRKWQIVGFQEQVKKGIPIIFAANHQNALMDPLNVACAASKDRQTTFLTRADVFVSWALPAMRVLKMKPIYRQRDGVDSLEKNKAIFEECVELLSHNESLIIFPEGNHGRPRKLRPLKKGAARIAFQGAEANQFDFPLEVVPVGLNYDQHRKFHNDMLVVFGEPIQLADYYDLFKENQGKAILQLTKDLRTRLSQYMVHIMNAEHYDTIEGLRNTIYPEILQTQQGDMKDLHDRLLAQQEIVRVLESRATSHPEEMSSLGPGVKTYLTGLKELRFRDHVIRKGPYSMGRLLMQTIALILGLPLHVYGVINNYHIYKACERLTKKIFKDDHFHSSIMLLCGMVFYPIFYAIQGSIVWAMTDIKIALIYLISLPFSGEFAIWYSVQVKKWWSRLRFWQKNRQGDAQLEKLISLRKHFVNTVLEWRQTQEIELDRMRKS